MTDPFLTYALAGVLLFVVASVGGLAAVGVIVVRLPVDYLFDDAPRRLWMDRHPIVRQLGLALKNVVGACLVALGVVLSLPGVPGPGILTIVIGITLLDLPRKRRLERWLIGRPATLQAINDLRRRWNRPPLRLP